MEDEKGGSGGQNKTNSTERSRSVFGTIRPGDFSANVKH